VAACHPRRPEGGTERAAAEGPGWRARFQRALGRVAASKCRFLLCRGMLPPIGHRGDDDEAELCGGLTGDQGRPFLTRPGTASRGTCPGSSWPARSWPSSPPEGAALGAFAGGVYLLGRAPYRKESLAPPWRRSGIDECLRSEDGGTAL